MPVEIWDTEYWNVCLKTIGITTFLIASGIYYLCKHQYQDTRMGASLVTIAQVVFVSFCVYSAHVVKEHEHTLLSRVKVEEVSNLPSLVADINRVETKGGLKIEYVRSGLSRNAGWSSGQVSLRTEQGGNTDYTDRVFGSSTIESFGRFTRLPIY